VDIGERPESVQAYAQEQGLTFPMLLDESGGVAERYRVPGIPTSFFINRQGGIHVQHTGPLNDALIEKYLDQIL
jgi:peroxiredoxin